MSGGFELRNQIRHCKTVCIKRNLYLINYNRMRTQWTTNGNRDAGSSCLCDRGLHRYLQNFGGGGVEHPKPPSRYATDHRDGQNNKYFSQYIVLFSSCLAHMSFINPSIPASVHCTALAFLTHRRARCTVLSWLHLRRWISQGVLWNMAVPLLQMI